LQQAQAQMGDATHAVNGAANRGARRSKIAATRPLGWRARPANPPWRRRGSYRFPPDRSYSYATTRTGHVLLHLESGYRLFEVISAAWALKLNLGRVNVSHLGSAS
jgi:hypothetical protein